MEKFNFKKKYGQNFLVDTNVVNKIVHSVDVLPNSMVIEIGCGDGRLTKSLCSKFDFVLGYEIDEEVKDNLLFNLKEFTNFSICFGDFLKMDVLADLKKFSYTNLYVVSNLPYYITTPIIEKLIQLNLDVKEMIFMVQKEVGDRFCAKVGTKEYNSLSVYLNYKYDVKKLFVVSRNCFLPKPNVDSVIVSFKKRDKVLEVVNEELFYKLVRDSFRFKRKTLRNNLFDYNLVLIEAVLKKYNKDLSCRAEELSIDVFCDIANNLSI